jgi:hypothetical protein
LIVVTLSKDREKAPRAATPSNTHAWESFVRVYPIYSALSRHLGLSEGPYPPGADAAPWPTKDAWARDLCWLDEVDQRVQAVDLRKFLSTPAAAREEDLRLFLQRQLRKSQKLPADRDKIDLLIVQYFVLCAPQSLIDGDVEFEQVAEILRPVIGEMTAPPPASCEALDGILDAAQECHSLRDMVEQGSMEQGRLAKEATGESFYEPAALVSMCRFNFILRRTFIQLLHADLRAIGKTLDALERKGVESVDCRRAGLSASEPLAQMKQFHQHWKAPFHDYSQGSSFRAYEQLMSLREDLEEALGSGSTVPAPAQPSGAARKRPKASATESRVADPAPSAEKSASSSPAGLDPERYASLESAIPGSKSETVSKSVPKESKPAPEQNVPAAGIADVEVLEEKIWEQLISTPPTRGRSMTTVTVEETRVLLSAWEVAAFVSDSGPESDELRRVIVARALLSTAMERWKRFLDVKTLYQAVAHARGEIPRFQERIEHLKRTAKTDSAVNLGISLKRLLSLVEEADQLQTGSGSKEKR